MITKLAAAPVDVVSKPSLGEFVKLFRDPNSDEWELDFSPGLDLLELARVLGDVQAKALEMIQDQLAALRQASAQ